ncbi:hypothetical protein UT300009_29800 [Paraclostridium bifermentans]
MTDIERITETLGEDEEKGIIISMTSFPKVPFVTFIEYDDSEITFSKQLADLMFMYDVEYKDGKFNVEQVVNGMLDLADKFKDNYYQYLEEDCPSSATMFCDKRDKTKQFYKMMLNEHFTDESMYKFALQSYSSIEDGYGYDLLLRGIKLYKKRCDIQESIKKDLKDHIDNEGYVIIYRGINNKSREDGTSYTLDTKVAKFFANRWNSNGHIKKCKVHIDDILGYIDNGESEIITEKAIVLDEDFQI